MTVISESSKGLLEACPKPEETPLIEGVKVENKHSGQKRQEPSSLGIPRGRADNPVSVEQIRNDQDGVPTEAAEVGSIKEFDTISGIIRSYEPERHSNCSDSWTTGCVLKNGRSVLVIRHPEDSTNFSKKVNEIIYAIQYFGQEDKSEKIAAEIRGNWNNFAEKALDEFDVLVVILSQGMNELCNSDGEDFIEKLVINRCGENIPVIVLDRLRTILCQKLNKCQHRVYVIALEPDVDEGNRLVEDFLQKHDFIKRLKEKESSYVIPGESVFLSDEFKAFLKALTKTR